MPDRRLRWGVLSTASIAGEKGIPGVRRAPRQRGEIVAIASRNGPLGRRIAEELRIPRSHESYDALLADPDVDAVYIPLPNSLHVEWTRRALEAGKHVLCEKPLTDEPDDAEALFDLAEREGLTL